MDEIQKKIVKSSNRFIVVSAGAGTGKTTVLTERIKYLLNIEKLSRYDILALTFTRYAAEEMKDRLISNSKFQISNLPHIMTFHAFALYNLRKYGSIIGLRRNLDVITETERDSILKDTAKSLGIKLSKDFQYRQLIYELSGISGDYKIVIAEYLRITRLYGLIDYDMLIKGFYALLIRNGEIQRLLHKQYKHILIDEFQDTNRHIFNIIEKINPINLFVVGDVDQCIYKFNGAEPEIMVGLSEKVKGKSKKEKTEKWKLYRLERNYRCPNKVIEWADNLIKHNKNRIKRNLYGTKDEGVANVIITDDLNEALLSTVLKIGQKEDIAILCRTNSDIFKADRYLRAQIIDCEKYDSSVKMQSPYFLFFISALRLLNNPRNNIACKHIYRTYFKDGILLYKKSALKAERTDKPVIEIIAKKIKFLNMFLEDRDQYRYAWDAFYKFLLRLPIFNIEGDRDRDFKLLEKMINEDPHILLNDFLANLSMRSVQDELLSAKKEETEDHKGVKIMTVHAAKGLEFDYVILNNAVKSKFPILRKDTDFEEERRIFYVAMTRAVKELVILSKREKESQYLREISKCKMKIEKFNKEGSKK